MCGTEEVPSEDIFGIISLKILTLTGSDKSIQSNDNQVERNGTVKADTADHKTTHAAEF